MHKPSSLGYSASCPAGLQRLPRTLLTYGLPPEPPPGRPTTKRVNSNNPLSTAEQRTPISKRGDSEGSSVLLRHRNLPYLHRCTLRGWPPPLGVGTVGVLSITGITNQSKPFRVSFGSNNATAFPESFRPLFHPGHTRQRQRLHSYATATESAVFR